MSLPIIQTIAIDTIAVLLSAGFMESFSTDEQVIIGSFFNVLGDLIALNSSYIDYIQPSKEDAESITKDSGHDEYELLKKSVDKLQEEMIKIKKCE